ncbi:MAG: hypothetical protein WCG21_02565 [Eubacteriales bacterium]
MTWIIAFALMGLATVFFSVQFGKKFEESMPVITFSIILILFLFGLADQLKAGFWVAAGGCVVLSAGGIVLAEIQKKTNDAAANLFTPAFFIFMLLSFVIWYYDRGMVLTGWDEFSHWGRVVKATFMSNQLSTYTDIELTFRSYPPALSLYQYFLMSIRGKWDEANLFRGYAILAVTLFLPFMKNIKWGNVKTIISTVLLVILTPMLFFGSFYTSVLVDPILALFFGYCLAEAYLYEKGNVFSLVRICMGLSVLAILKESGQFLAVIACIVLIAKSIYMDVTDDSAPGENTKVHSPLNVRKLIYRLRFILLLAVPVVTSALWNLNMTLTHTTRIFSGSIDWDMLKAILGRNTDNYRMSVYDNFINTLSSGSLTPGFFTGTFYFWAAFLGLLLYFLYYFNRKDLRFAGYANLITISGLVLFTAGLLITYLFRFSEYEATILSSFQRYISTYLQGMFACAVMILLFCTYSHRQEKPNRMAVMKLVLLVFLAIFIPMNNITNITTGRTRTDAARMRDKFSGLVQKVKNSGIAPGDKIWIIAEHTDGFEYWILKYEFIQQYAEQGAFWSLGDKSSDKDVWTADLTADQWEQQLADYDYVVIYCVDDTFTNRYKSLFADEKSIWANSIYEVVKDGSNITLKYVK